MKKLIVLFVTTIVLSVPALAQHRGHHWHGNGYRNNWVAPLVLGSALTYAMTRPTVIYTAPPMYSSTYEVVQEPRYVVIDNNNPAPIGYHWENLIDANCKCVRTVLLPN
jgi:hypothetical protein